MLVDHVTFSKTGGAGEVAGLLAKAQIELGADAQLLYLIDKDLRAEAFHVPTITAAAALDKTIVSNHSTPMLISFFRSKLNRLNQGRLRSSSIIHLHWVSGLMDHKRVRSLLDSGRKVVWTLHDMAPFTGTCHHSHGCDGFEGECARCPQVRSAFQRAVKINLEQKIFNGFERNLTLVSPTPWLAHRAKKSSAFRNQRIEVIENPIRYEFYQGSGDVGWRQRISLRSTKDQLVFTAVASDLSNPAKGIQNLVDIFLRIRPLDQSIKLNLIGRRGEAFHSPQSGVYWRGSLGTTELIRIARESNLLISNSVAESAGLTVREFGSLGIPTLALRSGGIEDLIQDGVSGLLASNESDLTEKLSKIIKHDLEISLLGDSARELAIESKPSVCAQKYMDVYSSTS